MEKRIVNDLLHYNLLIIIVVIPFVVTVVSTRRGKAERYGTEISCSPSEWLSYTPRRTYYIYYMLGPEAVNHDR